MSSSSCAPASAISPIINNEIAHTIDQSTAASSDRINTAGTQLTELLQSASGNIVYHLKATSQEVAQQIEKSGIVVASRSRPAAPA